MALMNQKKYFIHRIHNNECGPVLVQCNEWNIEQEKDKLPNGLYKVVGVNVDYNFKKEN